MSTPQYKAIDPERLDAMRSQPPRTLIMHWNGTSWSPS